MWSNLGQNFLVIAVSFPSWWARWVWAHQEQSLILEKWLWLEQNCATSHVQQKDFFSLEIMFFFFEEGFVEKLRNHQSVCKLLVSLSASGYNYSWANTSEQIIWQISFSSHAKSTSSSQTLLICLLFIFICSCPAFIGCISHMVWFAPVFLLFSLHFFEPSCTFILNSEHLEVCLLNSSCQVQRF